MADSITIIRLYTDNLLPATPVTSYLEMDSKTVVPLNFAIGDIRDISKKKGTFSKSIKVPGTHNNNKVLNNYYDVNIQASTFNLNTLQKCAIIQDGVVILDNAILQLVSVDKIQENNSYEDIVSYTMLIKDSTSDFFTTINNRYLTDINLSEFDHIYKAENVVSTFGNTQSYKYILPYNGMASGNVEGTANDASYELNEMLPGVFAKLYFDRIFNGAGYIYDWDISSTSFKTFERLVIPYNGDAIVSNKEPLPEYNVLANRAGITTLTTSVSSGIRGGAVSWSRSNPANIQFYPEVNDPAGIYDPNSLTPYSVPSFPGPTNNLKVTVTLNHTLTKTGGAIPYSNQITCILYLKAQIPGSTISTALGSDSSQSVSFPFLASGPITLKQGAFKSIFTVPLSTITPGTKLFIEAEIRGSGSGGGYDATYAWNITSGSINYDIELDGAIGYNVPFKMNKVIPQKIKQSDFVKGLLTMFNLYVIVDKEVSNKLTIISRDDYYDAGAIKDWTKKLVKNKEQELKFLPEISNKKAILTYKEDGDLVNTKYKQNSNEVYGQIEYIFDNEYVKDVTKTELLFSPTPMTNTSFGAICSVINGAAPKTNIRVVYDGGTFSCSQYLINNYAGNQLILDTYPLTIHWDRPTNPTIDLNFLPCDYYYRTDDWGSNTNNNLFNLYWRRTLNQINEGKLLTAHFHLNAYDINQLKLNDKIRIDNSWWNINTIKDYDANSKVPTKVELISVDGLLSIFQPVVPTTTTAAPTTTTAAPTTTTAAPTTTTTTAAPTCNNVTYGPAMSGCTIYWQTCAGVTQSAFVSVGNYLSLGCVRMGSYSGCGPFTVGSSC